MVGDGLPNCGRICGTLHLGPRTRQTEAGVAETRPKAVPFHPGGPAPLPSTSRGVVSDNPTEVPIEVVKVVERLQEELGEAKTVGEKAEKSKP